MLFTLTRNLTSDPIMSNLTIGSVGYVLGKCPVLVLTSPTAFGRQDVLYLRTTQRGGYKQTKQFEIVAIRSMTVKHQKRYEVTDSELNMGLKYAKEKGLLP